MKQISIIISALILLTIGCKTKDEKVGKQYIIQESEVKISGRIDSVTSRIASISYYDLVWDDARYSKVVDSLTGKFDFVIRIHHPQDITFTYGGKSLQLFVEPNDSIFISFSAPDFKLGVDGGFKSVEFSGSNKNVNNDMLQYMCFRSVESFAVEPKNLSIAQYLDTLKYHMDRELEEVERFIEEFKPTDKFSEWAKNNAIYMNANYLVDYQFYLKATGRLYNDSLFESPHFPIHNSKGFVSSMFMHHLLTYASEKYYRADSTIRRLYFKGDKAQAYIETVNKIINSEPSGVIRDYMVFRFMMELANESHSLAKSTMEGNENLFSNATFATAIEKVITDKQSQKEGDIFYLSSYKSTIKQFKGNPIDYIKELSLQHIVYVDIWATWCAPCIDEIPYLLEIQKDFDKLGVKVVTLCCRSDKEKWSQLIIENQLPGTHFLFDSEQTKTLSTMLNYSGYPTYMIFANGEILERKAPRPSSRQIVLDRIQSYIANNQLAMNNFKR
jgi:thiol-disulfide isomerase/thioredoxin